MHLEIGILSAVLATAVLAQNSTKYAVKEPPLTTDWTYKVGTNPWPEYPRPQLERADWQNLNGIWTYQNASSSNPTDSPPFGQILANEVLIPSCLESGLSGLSEPSQSLMKKCTDMNTGIQGEYTINSWFSTSFTVPSSWSGKQVLLNFGAVDYEATVYINGKQAGFNRGGYFRFAVDATEHLNSNGINEL